MSVLFLAMLGLLRTYELNSSYYKEYVRPFYEPKGFFGWGYTCDLVAYNEYMSLPEMNLSLIGNSSLNLSGTPFIWWISMITPKQQEPNIIRLKVLSDDVEVYTKRYRPKQYSSLFHRYEFDDHRTFLKIGKTVIGFMVSPYNLNPHRHRALAMEGHTVVELRQYYHERAETLAVIKNEFLKYAVEWRRFQIIPITYDFPLRGENSSWTRPLPIRQIS